MTKLTIDKTELLNQIAEVKDNEKKYFAALRHCDWSSVDCSSRYGVVYALQYLAGYRNALVDIYKEMGGE